MSYFDSIISFLACFVYRKNILPADSPRTFSLFRQEAKLDRAVNNGHYQITKTNFIVKLLMLVSFLNFIYLLFNIFFSDKLKSLPSAIVIIQSFNSSRFPLLLIQSVVVTGS